MFCFQNQDKEGSDGAAPEKSDDDAGDVAPKKSYPLRGIVLGVSKKLNARQSEFNSVAASLGADYRWTYDQSCTHFIFQGRSNDNSKEFKLAKEQKKFIVSPHWLTVVSFLSIFEKILLKFRCCTCDFSCLQVM